jgi:hypothetical protein
MSTRRPPATLALVVWTLFVWTTRIRNIWGDDALTGGEKWGRTGLAMSFTVLALAAGHAAWHSTSWRTPVVKVFAAWTIAVWVVRSIGIATGDHDSGFIAVHLVLAVVSIALSAAAVRETAKTPVSV